MKIFKNGAGLSEDLAKIVERTRDKSTKIIANQFVEDSNKGLVPKLSGDLQQSVTLTFGKEIGQIIWSMPYARRRYFEGSISGVPLWAEVNKNRNGKKYRGIVNDIFKEEKKKKG